MMKLIFLLNLFTNRYVSNLHKVFANSSPLNIKLPQTQLSKMIHLAGFLSRFLVPILKTGLPLIKM